MKIINYFICYYLYYYLCGLFIVLLMNGLELNSVTIAKRHAAF